MEAGCGLISRTLFITPVVYVVGGEMETFLD